MDIYDGYFEIIIENQQVFLEVFPPQKDGKLVQLNDVIDKLAKLNIQKYNYEKIQEEIGNQNEHKKFRIDISSNEDQSKENDKMVAITISSDNMKVLATFYPGDANKELTVDEVVREVRKLDVTIPVDEEMLSDLLKEYDYNKQYDILSGQPPKDGKPNRIIQHFKTKDDLKPELDEDGNVNYHKLNLVSNVKKNQLLAELECGEEGVDGIDVFGKTVQARKPKIIKILRGKNTTLSDDFKKLYSDVDGLVQLDAGKILVNEVYEVANNVGVSTGDVEFNGTVIIHGSITSGFNVYAKGDVEVMGVIESSTVDAGGNIVAHRGIQGGSNCNVIAQGDINAKYIENATVKSGGTIHSEAILHSTVSASEDVIVEGKKGMISGGAVRAGTEVKANILGSHMGTVTKVDVGIDPILMEEYNDIRTNLPKIKGEMTKLEQVITLLNKKKEIDGQLDEKKQEMYVSATRNKIFLANKINISQRKFLELQELVDIRNDGKVYVRGTVYPGVKISIGNTSYFVKDAIQYVEFYKKGADIKLEAL